MGDDKNRMPLIPISGVLVILAALGVTIITQPFKGARPPTEDYRECHTKVNARLWQDPFQAVLDGAKNRERLSPCEFRLSPGKSTKTRKQSCPASMGGTGKEGKLTVLGVMVPGMPYAEDTEKRMRYRYAVLSGLGRLGYVPEDSDHIEFMRVVADGEPKGYTLSNVMPLEWLADSKPGADKSRMLVLWMNDSVFEKKPLTKIGLLAQYLGPLTGPDKERFKIIGPARSETLREMVKEAWWEAGNKAHQKAGGPEYEIYSAMATVDDQTLLSAVVCEEHPKTAECNETLDMSDEKARDKIEKAFDAAGFGLHRTIGTDKGLALALIDELQLRNVDLVNHDEEVLLVAEWDTLYGRSFEMEKSIREKLYLDTKEKKGPSLSEPEFTITLMRTYGRVHRISYLRGIDGKLPGEKEEKKDDRKDGKDEAKNDVSKDTRKLEQPVGKSQYDYLRRLSEEVGRLNDESRRERRGEIRAVGVMGTDFYDKYLVLQALHQKLPDAIYFTTDLDARYLHSDNMEWTRNLVVASNFNLSLRNDSVVNIQGEIPPFRDSYQTSVFFAVLKAVGGEICPPRLTKCMAAQRLTDSVDSGRKPMIFEIGRKKAVLLTDPGDSIHPLRGRPYWGGWRIFAVAVLALAVLILTSTYLNNVVKWFFCGEPPAKKEKSVLSRPAYRIAAFVIMIAAVAGVASLIYCVSGREGEEPFSIFGGISVWPTEILRIMAIALSWIFFYRARRIRRESTKHIAEDFRFEPLKPGGITFEVFKGHVNKLVRPWKWNWRGVPDAVKKFLSCSTWDRWFSDALDLGWEPEDPQSHSLKGLYQAYRDHDKGRTRFWRVTIVTALYLGFCLAIVSYDFPVSPVRGSKTLWIDRGILAICVISFAILLVYVFDVTTACRRFISLASKAFAEKGTSENNREARGRIRDEMELIRLVAQRSADIQRLIFFPFIVWLIMIASRLTYFDNWRTPVGLGIVLSVGAAFAWASALLLRLTAEKARARIIHWLKDLQTGAWLSSRTARQVEEALIHISSIRTGAFAPLAQHPVLHVLLMAFGSLGGIFGLDLLAKLNL